MLFEVTDVIFHAKFFLSRSSPVLEMILITIGGG